MHLTSQDGDWFLDELCTMCANIAQLLSVLKNNPLVSLCKTHICWNQGVYINKNSEKNISPNI